MQVNFKWFNKFKFLFKGTFAYSIIGGFALGEEDLHFNHMLWFLFIFLVLNTVISIYTLHYDRNRRDILSVPKIKTNRKRSNTPQPVIDWLTDFNTILYLFDLIQ